VIWFHHLFNITRPSLQLEPANKQPRDLTSYWPHSVWQRTFRDTARIVPVRLGRNGYWTAAPDCQTATGFECGPNRHSRLCYTSHSLLGRICGLNTGTGTA